MPLPSLPPSYSQACLSPKVHAPTYDTLYPQVTYNHNETVQIITNQPVTVRTLNVLDEIEILGLYKGDFSSTDRDISHFIHSKNYLAFNQIIDYRSCCSLSTSNNVTVINTDRNNHVLTKEIPLDTNDIFFSPDNKKIIASIGDNEYSEFSLINQNKNITSKVNFPTDKVYSTSYDHDKNLYLIGMKDNQLCLYKSGIELENLGDNWKKITNLSVDRFNDARFSNNGKYLFILQEDEKLQIFNKTSNWSNIASISSVKTFPVDIDSSSGTMVFVDKNQLVIKELKKDSNYHCLITLPNQITTACFIPETKDLLVFDHSKNMKLIKYIKNDNKYIDQGDTIKLDSIIKKAYFNPRDKTQLIALFTRNHLEKENNSADVLAGLWGIGGIGGGILKTCCFDGGIEKIICSAICWKNIGIGLGIGLGIIAAAIFIKEICLDANKKADINQIPTRLVTVKEPKNNVISRV